MEPLSKGGNANTDRYLIRVGENIPSVQACCDFVGSDPSCGAIASFAGITRDNFNGKRVTKLSYEGYIPMAEKELKKLCNNATLQYPSIRRIAAVHIVGDCSVGMTSVIVAASSPHRRDALHCVEFLIDELKATIPIWKKEVYEGDERSVWKENVEWHQGKQRRVMVKHSEDN